MSAHSDLQQFIMAYCKGLPMHSKLEHRQPSPGVLICALGVVVLLVTNVTGNLHALRHACKAVCLQASKQAKH